MTNGSMEHTVKAFDTDINELRGMVAEIGGRSEQAIAKAMRALEKHDLKLAAEVVAEDKIIDELETTRRGPYAGAVGYVDFGHAVWLAVPALFTARLGVRVAARVDVQAIRWGFAALATVVALRLIWRALT